MRHRARKRKTKPPPWQAESQWKFAADGLASKIDLRSTQAYDSSIQGIYPDK